MDSRGIIVEQLEESKRLIQRKTIPSYRMAIILLDNATELIMLPHIKGWIEWGVFFTPVIQQAGQAMSEREFEHWRRNLPKMITEDEKMNIERYFDKKVNILEAHGELSSGTAKVLKQLHRFRNGLHHRLELRVEILKNVSCLFYEFVCKLLVELSFLSDKEDKALLKKLRSGITLTPNNLRRNLRDHLLMRFNYMKKKLAYAHRILGHKSIMNTLKVLQMYKLGIKPSKDNIEDQIRKHRAKVYPRSLETWKESLRKFDSVRDKEKMYSLFSESLQKLEPIESIIVDAADQLEAHIESQAEMLRGK